MNNPTKTVTKRIHKQSRPLSAIDYRLARQGRITRRIEELSEAEISAISRLEVPPEHRHLDEELM